MLNYKMAENGFISELEFGTLNISSNSDYGFRPFQLLVSSIVGCSGGLFHKVLEKMRISFDNIEIEADVKRSGGQVNTVESISLRFIVYGDHLSEEKVKKALKVALENCAMAQSVKGAIEIKESFKIVNNS